MNKESIVLGSGDLYCTEFEGTDKELPTNEVLETEENRLGHIKGGAEIEYAPSFYEAKDDMGKVSKVIITEEEATLKSGIMTWCGTTLQKLNPGDGDVRVTIVGNNQAGFTIAFAKDSETVIDAEFKAQPMDKEGTLILYEEDMDVTEEAAGPESGGEQGSGGEPGAERKTVRAAREKPPGRLFHERRMRAWQ